MAHSKGKGTTLTVNAVVIPQIVSLVPPGWAIDKIDTTSLDSDWMECDSTIPDPAPITGVLNYDPVETAHQGLETLAASGAIVACSVSLPSALTVYNFNAYVSQWNAESVDVKAIHKKSFALQPVGAITPVYD
jgi:hypothetical protein